MKHPVHQLQSDLDQFLYFLEKGSLFSFNAEEKQTLRTKGNELLQKLETIESSQLTVGLIGGTGVGKSTLMNALAGSEIASASHRRPHTEKVLIYRHVQANPLSRSLLNNVPWHEITHQVDEILHVILCDLPDFDSMVEEHRKYVIDFLENLDILAWVTSPEKYADQRFYEFLQSVPKAEQNFYFVLNKTDLLFLEENLKTAYDSLERVVASFQKHVVEKGIDHPLLYTLSAEQIRGGASINPWNQFPAFKREIFQQRDIKQISAIKAANLDVEIGQLLFSFQKELHNLELFEQILEKSLNDLNDQIPLWIEAGQEAIDLWIEQSVKPRFLFHQGDLDPLVGPTYGIAHFLGMWRQRSAPSNNLSADLYNVSFPQDIAVSFARRFEWLKERLGQRILFENLPTSFGQAIDEILDTEKSIDDLKERFLRVSALRISVPHSKTFIGFKAVQLAAYAVLFILFLIGIGGGQAWRELIEVPGASSILHLILSVIQTVFSTKGLAALGSYTILNILLAFRFYRQYRKRQEKAAQNASKSLKLDLVNIWQGELKSIHDDLEALKANTQTQRSTILSVSNKRKGLDQQPITSN
ncbi:MAG: 50S ribosome-binding GTPase [Deltaproteobacteria bacterium]|nr:50S ribosome-binding GTPase [Deltaproteobacteria bacterium]